MSNDFGSIFQHFLEINRNAQQETEIRKVSSFNNIILTTFLLQKQLSGEKKFGNNSES